MNDLKNFKKVADTLLKDINVSEDLKKRTIEKCQSSKNKIDFKQIYLTAASLLFLLITVSGFNSLISNASKLKTIAQNGEQIDSFVQTTPQIRSATNTLNPKPTDSNATNTSIVSNNADTSVALNDVPIKTPPVKATNRDNSVTSNNSVDLIKPVDNNTKQTNQGLSNSITTSLLASGDYDDFPDNLKNDIASINGIRGYKIFDLSEYNIVSDYIYIYISTGNNSLKEVTTSKIDSIGKTVLFVATEDLENNNLNNYSIMKVKRNSFTVNVYNTKGVKFDLIK